MNTAKKIIALVLVLSMLLSFAACGKKEAQKPAVEQSAPTVEIPENPTSAPVENSVELDRQEKELIAELVGGAENVTDMTNEELDGLVDELIDQVESGTTSGVVDLSENQVVEQPSVDTTQHPDAYDEEGAMTKPFDQVYPELIEQEQVSFSGESILVKMASDTLTDGLKAAGIGALEKIVPMGDVAWYEAKLIEGADPESALEAVRKLEEVLLAEFNYEVEVAALDDYKHFDKEQDEEFKKNGHNKDQWHFHYCGIVDGYEEMEHPGGDPSVVVAVIDSGVDYDHEDLIDNMWVNAGEIPNNGIDDDNNGYTDDYYGVDIVAGYGNGDDTNGHGTHVAGIIAARNNNVGVLGVAYNVKIMSVKAAMHNGTLNQADIAKAVLYAYEMGAEVINMSFGGTACSIAVQDALATAYTRCVLVASAGNNGMYNEGLCAMPSYPAALTYVLGVMSVDETGRESVFTNWDVFKYNSVEYELYAPGENIMSTLPNNKYGYLSGTSMAAPIVSGFAAILRSEFKDRDKYPTKFIYGQLASTSEIYADCLNPAMHGIHNLPQVADLNAALTKLPKPEVSLQDYALFDDPKYSSKNNGDGVIDAGETIALGLTLRNRWGMSENTKVTIDTISASSGMSDPYITIQNPTVNYGSVGTYSTQDCGAVYTDGLLSGWENPFLLEISEKCPNDYRFTLNVVIRCENALDENDNTLYISGDDPLDASTLDPMDPIKVNENVRSGYILPSVIDKDMVLTKDNLYIIPNATVIKEGVTVRVEPGTHIQFWGDDANDPYADSYIAYLLVNGNFLVEGTKEEPVYIYPSQLMDRYHVEFGSGKNGYTSLKYADITNFMIGYNNSGTSNRIDWAEHCTFRNNYMFDIVSRQLVDGVVQESSWHYSSFGRVNAKDCIFYKCGMQILGWNQGITGYFDRCIFNQCSLAFANEVSSYQDCVFLGNWLDDQSGHVYGYTGKSASLLMGAPISQADRFAVLDVPNSSSTYLTWYIENTWEGGQAELDAMAEYIHQIYGGGYFVPETIDEFTQLRSFGLPYHWYAGIYREGQNYYWSDGTPVQEEFFPMGHIDNSDRSYYSVCDNKLVRDRYQHVVFEIPRQVLPDVIMFDTYRTTIDTETTYQIVPKSYQTQPADNPLNLPLDSFIYESRDESVVTVSDTGLVTPVSQGTVDVYVYSLDRAVYNYVTFEVEDAVPLEGIAFSAEKIEIPAGVTMEYPCVLTPADTTRRNVVYTSSNEQVAVVSGNGRITGVAPGTVTITATCEGITAVMDVTVYIKATSLTPEKLVIIATPGEEALELPGVATNKGADINLSWRSTDESVVKIEDGKIIPVAAGVASLIVSDQRSGLSAVCLVVVGEQSTPVVKDMQIAYDWHYVLLENGDLYYWGYYSHTPVLAASNVSMFAAQDSYRCLVLQADGFIREVLVGDPNNIWINDIYDVSSYEIADYAYYNGNHFIVTTGGNVYAWGTDNSNGELGVGTMGTVDSPSLVNLDGVVDVTPCDNATWFLTDKGDLYVTGSINDCKEFSSSLIPLCVENDVAEILYVNNHCAYRTVSGELKLFNYSPYDNEDYFTVPVDVSDMDKIDYQDWWLEGIGIRDGEVYLIDSGHNLNLGFAESVKHVPGIVDAVDVYTCEGTHYIVTESGMLYGLGRNNGYNYHMAGFSNENPVTTPILIPLAPLPEQSVELKETSLVDGVLVGDTLKLTFDKVLTSIAPKLYRDGAQITVQSKIVDYNYLEISRNNGFTEGVTYELVFVPESIYAVAGSTNADEIRISFTYVPAPDSDITEPDSDATEATPDQEQGQNPDQEQNQEEEIHESQLDTTIVRDFTPKGVAARVKDYIETTQYNPRFSGNAILNPISTDTDVTHWLRPMANRVEAGSYQEVPLAGNWWGTTNEKAIELQMVDYTDFVAYSRLVYAPYLTEAPENTFPFVTSVKLFNKYGEEVTTVSNEQITFQVKFNRDMDTSIPLLVRFGSAYPYGDYEVEGTYVNARTWEGTYTLNTIIENGNQYFTISNGCSATEDLELQTDQKRFGFTIDTTAAQALIMQGTAMDTGINLTWTQDDFATLMGYNVYRSTAEDGYYTRLNTTVIPADTMTWFDDTVEPGVVYYYNFTVVQTDMAESIPSGKIVIMSKDTMAPNIYHSPVVHAFTNANLIVNATITDNLNIAYANLHYRMTGTSNWNTVRMSKLNDKYSAIIPAQYVTTEGVEYYIEAFDGVSYTYKGTEDTPYVVNVQESIDANSLGDVDGDGVITNLDALLLLYTINDKYNMTAEEFARSDLNGDGELWAAEALRILQYVNGTVGSVKM